MRSCRSAAEGASTSPGWRRTCAARRAGSWQRHGSQQPRTVQVAPIEHCPRCLHERRLRRRVDAVRSTATGEHPLRGVPGYVWRANVAGASLTGANGSTSGRRSSRRNRSGAARSNWLDEGEQGPGRSGGGDILVPVRSAAIRRTRARRRQAVRTAAATAIRPSGALRFRRLGAMPRAWMPARATWHRTWV